MPPDPPAPDQAGRQAIAAMAHNLGDENRETANTTSLDPAILGNSITERGAGVLSASDEMRELQLISNQLFRAANELKRTNLFQSMILDNINQGIVVVDEYSQLVAWNEVFLRLYGLGKHTLHKGMHVQDFAALFLGSADGPQTAGKLSHNSRLSSLKPGKYLDRLANGTSFEIRVAKRTTGILIATFTDVTAHIDTQARLKEQGEKLRLQVDELKALGQSLEASRNQAMLANQQKSRFLAMISHDIRTPIGAVISTLELLSDPATQGDRDRLHQVALASGKQMLFLLADIIEVSRSDGWNFVSRNEPVAINKLLHFITDSWRPLAAQKQLRLDLQCPETLPALLQTDPKRLRQVLDNLLSNAIKFTETGTISLVAYIAENNIRFEIRDTGRGMGHDTQHGLFQDFGRFNAADEAEVEGTGLGLSICKRIVEGMGGTIGVNSTPGSGSTFWLEIPCVLADVAYHPEHAAPMTGNLLTRAGDIPYILVADDVESNRLILGMMLEKCGCRFSTASDGQEVLARLETESFDAVLMDGHMPKIKGAEVTRRIRASAWTRNDIPIIGVTAAAIGDEQQDLLKAGMNAVLTKPVGVAKLRTILGRLIG